MTRNDEIYSDREIAWSWSRGAGVRPLPADPSHLYVRESDEVDARLEEMRDLRDEEIRREADESLTETERDEAYQRSRALDRSIRDEDVWPHPDDGREDEED